MSGSESDEDWFEKNENDILKKLQLKAIKHDANTSDVEVEYITGPSEAVVYLQQERLEAATEISSATKIKKITTAELRKVLSLETLDLFLHVATSESDYCDGQISKSDGLERVIIYLRIFCRLCELEVHSFQTEILEKFLRNEAFFDQLRVLVAKLFKKKFKSILKNIEIDLILYALKSLILQLPASKASYIAAYVRKSIQEGDNQDIIGRNSCKHLVHELDRILKVEKVQFCEKIEIYPSFDELLTHSDSSSKAYNLEPVEENDFNKYITRQKQILRDDFITPLRTYICQLKMPNDLELYEDVFIVLNKNFENAKRHEMLFVDILGSQRSKAISKKDLPKAILKKMATIKTGSLLIFSTTKQFENFILASVTYTDGALLDKGYIGIEIVAQYNLGPVYDRPLLMFESPVFFEPYKNVYNCLNNFSERSLPFKHYLIDGEENIRPPSYLKQKMSYTYDGKPFSLYPSNARIPKNFTLNQSQWCAYLEALTKEFCLIQGPPGTGKTYLSVQLMRTLIENANKPIVLITYTNYSLDKFLLNLCAYTSNILRFGSQTRLPEISKFNVNYESLSNELVNPNLKRLYYITNEEFKMKFKIVQDMHDDFDGSEDSYQRLKQAQKDVSNVSEKLKSIHIMFQFYAARKADVIAMTTTFAAKSNFLFQLLQSKIVIFEEAAEILESHVLACLTPYTEHVIMIGDHMQLKPFTASHPQSENSQLNVSLFERLFVNNFKGCTLYIQYRMRPSIAELLTPIFYKELKNDDSVQSYPKVRHMLKDLYFYTHKEFEAESKDECSIYNDFEINHILMLAEHLIKTASYTVGDIVILSPYYKQVKLLKKKAEQFFETSNLKIFTVDSFQGLEANIVLLSLVRSNSKNQIGFLREKNRICVALSRAKHGMYIIGNMSLLAKCSETWRAIEGKLEAQGAIGGMFPLSHG